jgi:HSP20 family protein
MGRVEPKSFGKWHGQATATMPEGAATDSVPPAIHHIKGGAQMRLTRWHQFNPVLNQLQQLQGEMNQLFNRWGEDGGRMLGLTGFPALNVWEDADAIHVEAELPGLDLKDLEIYVTGGNQLTLKGERKPNLPEKGVWHRQERSFGSFTRVLTLPYPVDADKVDARFENGVLLLKLAKHEAAKPRKIPVKAE